MKNLVRLGCIASMALAAFSAQAETYALMLGICDYPDVVDSSGQPVKDKDGTIVNNDLNGCVNDVKAYQRVLVDKYGVKKENVRMLLDKAADSDGLLEGVKWLVNVAKPGDQVFFFYSGHGTQYDSDKETDGKEEAIVLADMVRAPGSIFRTLSQNLSKAGMNATFVFDSCFSGGMTREARTLDGKAYIKRDRFLPASALGAKSKEIAKASADAIKGAPKKKGLAAGGSYAFVMAGNETEPTIDLDFKDPASEDHGLFSLIFLGVLEKLPDTPIQSAIQAIAEIFKEKDFDQHPTFEFSSEARGEKPFFLKG